MDKDFNIRIKLMAFYKGDVVEVKEVNFRVNGYTWLKTYTGEEFKLLTTEVDFCNEFRNIITGAVEYMPIEFRTK